MSDNERGMYVKYNVTKADTGAMVFDCFVLRPDRDRFAREALRAYADACHLENPRLARDIADWMSSIDGGPTLFGGDDSEDSEA